MNIFRILLSIVLCVIAFSASAQTVITITEDTVFEETLVFNENTILEGIDFPSVSFQGSPKFIINDSRVLLKGMRIDDKTNWGTINGDACLEWYGIGMAGSIQNGTEIHSTYLDGKEK